MPTTIDTTGHPAYMYDEGTSTWYAISGRISTAANYVWTGANEWQNNSLFSGGITATLKFNSFLNPAARTAAISSPSTGLITFIQQDASGNTVNKFQYWDGSAWTDIATVAYSSSSPNSPQAGNLWVKSTTNEIYVYTGSAWVLVSGGGGTGSAIDPFFLMGA